MVLSLEDREYEEPGQVIEEHYAIMESIESGESVKAQRLITELVEADENECDRYFENALVISRTPTEWTGHSLRNHRRTPSKSQ